MTIKWRITSKLNTSEISGERVVYQFVRETTHNRHFTLVRYQSVVFLRVNKISSATWKARHRQTTLIFLSINKIDI